MVLEGFIGVPMRLTLVLTVAVFGGSMALSWLSPSRR